MRANNKNHCRTHIPASEFFYPCLHPSGTKPTPAGNITISGPSMRETLGRSPIICTALFFYLEITNYLLATMSFISWHDYQLFMSHKIKCLWNYGVEFYIKSGCFIQFSFHSWRGSFGNNTMKLSTETSLISFLWLDGLAFLLDDILTCSVPLFLRASRVQLSCGHDTKYFSCVYMLTYFHQIKNIHRMHNGLLPAQEFPIPYSSSVGAKLTKII
jgi:hypothetical protein